MSTTCFRLAMIVSVMTAACSAPWQQPIQLGPAETGAGSLAAARKYLEGRWGLLSYDINPPGEAPMHLKGEGTLLYDQFGNLNVEIRVDEATALLLEKAGIRTTNGLFSTKGRTVVDMQARTLTYVLEGQPALGSPSGPLALNRPRHWEVDGNVLSLRTKAEDGKELSLGRWQKLP